MAKQQKAWTIVDENGADQYPHGGHDDKSVLLDWVAQHEALHPEETGKVTVVKKSETRRGDAKPPSLKPRGCLTMLAVIMLLIVAAIVIGG